VVGGGGGVVVVVVHVLVPCFMLLGHSQERNMNSRWPMKQY